MSLQPSIGHRRGSIRTPQRAPAWTLWTAESRGRCLKSRRFYPAVAPRHGISHSRGFTHSHRSPRDLTGALAQVYRPSSPHGILRPDTSIISIFSVTWYAPAVADWSRRARRRRRHDQSLMRFHRSFQRHSVDDDDFKAISCWYEETSTIVSSLRFAALLIALLCLVEKTISEFGYNYCRFFKYYLVFL